jgi:hypothetical protein
MGLREKGNDPHPQDPLAIIDRLLAVLLVRTRISDIKVAIYFDRRVKFRNVQTGDTGWLGVDERLIITRGERFSLAKE